MNSMNSMNSNAVSKTPAARFFAEFIPPKAGLRIERE
jgi:hypothetical protein